MRFAFLCLILLFPRVALATEPCKISARVSWSVICTDETLKTLAYEVEHLYTTLSTHWKTTPARLGTLSIRQEGVHYPSRDACLGRADEQTCLMRSLMANIWELRVSYGLEDEVDGLSSAPVALACPSSDRDLLYVHVGTRPERLWFVQPYGDLTLLLERDEAAKNVVFSGEAETGPIDLWLRDDKTVVVTGLSNKPEPCRVKKTASN